MLGMHDSSASIMFHIDKSKVTVMSDIYMPYTLGWIPRSDPPSCEAPRQPTIYMSKNVRIYQSSLHDFRPRFNSPYGQAAKISRKYLSHFIAQ